MTWHTRSAWLGRSFPRPGIPLKSSAPAGRRLSEPGPHPPRLWPEDLDRQYELWLKLSERCGGRLHYRDVVGVALSLLERNCKASNEEAIGILTRDLWLQKATPVEARNGKRPGNHSRLE